MATTETTETQRTKLAAIIAKNVLSFGAPTLNVDLGPLNVLVGANGSGKSNLLEILRLLSAAPNGLAAYVSEGGGVASWVRWMAYPTPTALVGAIIQVDGAQFEHSFSFVAAGARFTLTDELVGEGAGAWEFILKPGVTVVKRDGKLVSTTVQNDQSVLAQLKDPSAYPVMDLFQRLYVGIRVYREWTFGPRCPARFPQTVDLPVLGLTEDGRNLAHVLLSLRDSAATATALQENARSFLRGLDDIHFEEIGGTLRFFLTLDGAPIPAIRLSDGTLRWLALLAILLDPTPPPVVCIEEPELGLHPDMIPILARLLREASERTQVIITTHSDILVDALSDVPEAILVCERGEEGTTIRRLEPDALAEWLKTYSLGELWRRGQLGGNRW
jgi:predicted ATPase